jgi:hypothetical protein
MAPTSCFTGQVHRLPDAPEAYGAMITRAKAAPAQSRSADLRLEESSARLALPKASLPSYELCRDAADTPLGPDLQLAAVHTFAAVSAVLGDHL